MNTPPPFSRPQATVRVHLSANFLYGSFEFARMASELETTTAGPPEERRLRHQACVISSVLSAVGFLEACCNEIYVICADHPDDVHVAGHPTDARFRSIGTTTITQLGALWNIEHFQRNARILEKYQTALRIAGKSAFADGANPYQDAQLVIQLRNDLVHFKPEQREIDIGHGTTPPPDEIENRLRGKFADNPLAPRHRMVIPEGETNTTATYPFFPHRCLGSPCARWAYASVLALANEFFGRLGTTWYHHFLFDKALLPPV